MSAPYYRFRWLFVHAFTVIYALYALLHPRFIRKR